MKNTGLSKLVVSDRGLLDRLKNQTEDRRRSFGPESLLLLLDGSSSMQGTPWEQVDKAVRVLARASDSALCRLGVAIFSESADVFSSFKSDFRAVAAVIPQYPPGGMTAMRGGLELACKLSWPSPRRRVVLLSDGMPTDGDPSSAARALSEAGIVVDTVGCGDADRRVLANIAEICGGRFVMCDNLSQLPGMFLKLESGVRGLLSS